MADFADQERASDTARLAIQREIGIRPPRLALELALQIVELIERSGASALEASVAFTIAQALSATSKLRIGSRPRRDEGDAEAE